MKNLITAILLLFFSFSWAQSTGYSSTVRTTFAEGQKAFDQGDLATAHASFEHCLELDTNCYEAHYNLALISYGKEDYTNADVHIQQANTNAPFDPEILVLNGKIQFHLQAFERAEAALKTGISLGANSIENQRYLSKTLVSLGKLEEAERYYDQLIEAHPENGQLWLERGLLYLQKEDFEAAYADFENATKENETASLYLNLAKTAFELELYSEGISYIDKGKRNADSTTLVQLLLLEGNYYRLEEDHAAAEASYSKAEVISPKNTEVLVHQSALLIQQEEYESAILKCNEVLVLNPTSMEAYFNRGIANEMIRKVEDACSDWQQAFILGSQKATDYLNSSICNE